MHFHARDLQCIMKKNPDCKVEEMYMTHCINAISNEQKAILIHKGYWKHILSNRAQLSKLDPAEAAF